MNQVGEDRSHRLKDLSGILVGRRRSFQALRLGKRKLERLHQRFGKAVAPDRDRAGPKTVLRGDDQVGVLGSNVKQHRRIRLQQPLEVSGVVDGQRPGLNDDRLDGRLLEVQQVVPDQLPLHCEDADLDIGRPFLLERLVVPDDLVHVKGDLLVGLVADDVRNSFWGDWRQLCKA